MASTPARERAPRANTLTVLALLTRLALTRAGSAPGRAVRTFAVTVHEDGTTYRGTGALHRYRDDPYTLTLWVSYADRTATCVLDRDVFEDAVTFGDAPVDPATRAVAAVTVAHRAPAMTLTVRGPGRALVISTDAATVLSTTRRWRRTRPQQRPDTLTPPMNLP